MQYNIGGNIPAKLRYGGTWFYVYLCSNQNLPNSRLSFPWEILDPPLLTYETPLFR